MGETVLHNKRETMARVENEYRALDRVVRRLGTGGLNEDVPGFGDRARIRRERASQAFRVYERIGFRSNSRQRQYERTTA